MKAARIHYTIVSRDVWVSGIYAGRLTQEKGGWSARTSEGEAIPGLHSRHAAAQKLAASILVEKQMASP